MKKGEQEPEPGKPPAPRAPKEEPPAEFPMSVQEFARTYSPGRDTELMGGFIHYIEGGKNPEWTDTTLSVWVERFTEFRAMPTT